MSGICSSPRVCAVALLMGLPAIAVALGICVIEVKRPAAPTSTFAEAIAAGDDRTVYELVRAGRDPAASVAVSDPALTGGRTLVVPPLLWAVATQQNQIVPLLISLGAGLDDASRHRAACMATKLGNEEVALVLTADAASPCPVVPDTDPILIWLVGPAGSAG